MIAPRCRARGLKDQAEASIFGGKNQQAASYLDAYSDLLGGAGSMFGTASKIKNPNSGFRFSFG